MSFPTTFESILEAIEAIDPIAYAKTRNHEDGLVTRLSPYISRGVISTRMVMASIAKRSYSAWQSEKLLQELAWRDYFQRVGQAYPGLYKTAIKQEQAHVEDHLIPAAVAEGRTGIEAIDRNIGLLISTGYMHNHARMYTASLACNVGRSHWMTASRWMYYHLLDADVFSNACSWQWVAGAFSSKKYYANQENINKYFNSRQRNSFLDVDYAAFEQMEVPQTLQEKIPFDSLTQLPATPIPTIDPNIQTLIYNQYQLDPLWRKDEEANRILLLEPSHYKTFPVCERTIQFVLELSRNIKGIQVFVGEWESLVELMGPEPKPIRFKEHPLFRHYQGEADERDWMFPKVQGYYPSFFSYWKRCGGKW